MTRDLDSQEYFKKFPDTSQSARIILPRLFSMIGTPSSLVDLGGGVGVWSRVAKDLGVTQVTCVDDRNINRSELLIGEHDFVPANLSESMPEPISADLAVSLEVAEHLPLQMSRKLVEFLTRSAPIVLFSASIPGQPGLGHINEQAPKFWRSLFTEAGYDRWDVIRPGIVDNLDIPYWYRQNTFVFASPAMRPRLSPAQRPFSEIPADFELVHESILRRYRQSMETPGLARWLRLLPDAVAGAFKRRTEKRGSPA